MEKFEEVQKDAIDAIDRFLADNPELEELSDRLTTFNIFRTLRIEKAEIRHSNVLAWLLNPEESHSLGDIVLRRVLSNILLQGNANIQGISAAKIELMDFADIEILREWRNIDILVIDRTNKLLLLIENKIYSSESRGQLAKYKKAALEAFPSFVPILVFLTLTGEESDDIAADKYISYSHLQILGVLEKIFTQRQSQLPEQVAIFIRQYTDVLRRLTMKDESLVDLCKTIYRRHREAIDLIVECGMSGVGQQAVEEILSKEGEYEILRSRSHRVDFLPRKWCDIIPENGDPQRGLSRPVSVICFFEFLNKSECLRLIAEVSGMDDTQLRLSCVEKLRQAGFKLLKKASNENAKYSRFYSEKMKVSDLTDYEEVSEAAKKLLQDSKTEFPQAEKVFREVFGR
jgi:hypothetical protein